jgi:hypothetical protein
MILVQRLRLLEFSFTIHPIPACNVPSRSEISLLALSPRICVTERTLRVKAAYRAMDTMAAFASQQYGYSLDYFMIAGASKRGWTTWDVGAVDAASTHLVCLVFPFFSAFFRFFFLGFFSFKCG